MEHPGGLIVLGLAIGGWLLWLAVRAKPSDFDIEKIKDGFDKDQVRNIFGPPKDIRRTGSGQDEVWTYTIPFRLYVTITFGRDGLVSERYRSGET